MSQSKMSAAAVAGLVVLHAGLSFVVPRGPATAPRMSPGVVPEMDLAGGYSGYSMGAAVAVLAAGALVAGARSLVARKALHGIKFSYSLQKDAYADLEFLNDVGYLPDGTPMNRAGNAVNHPETIGPDPHTPGSPLPRAEFVNSIGYLPDGTAMNAAGNALNHPETMQPDLHTPGSPLPTSYYYADVGDLSVRDPETKLPGAPRSRVHFGDHSVASEASEGSKLSFCAGYLVDGTDLMWAGNNSVKAGAPIPPAPASSPAPSMAAPVMAGGVASGGNVSHPIGFLYAIQKDAYADLTFGNDVGYLPDGTAMNTAGNAVNHPETIGPDPHTPGSPLPRALFVNDVGYLPDGTPLNRAGNAINHPETIGPDPHSPGSPLPPSAYAADIGYLVDGTPLDAAGNNAIH
ncbi:unnamed protein product [Cladocopium goreaui]|uniref:Ribulose bisphosphate carboxylase, chloroplastic (RuBisCO) n=1 Tax=Cladocopium goreaui TaxID=2562237 RepID=A0A9P1CPM2_9DINO|nr:unnamed protein product [Cladocopium goreaui]